MRWRGRLYAAGAGGGLDRGGFTLVEILVSMAILAILTGVMLPMFGTIWLSNEQTETRQKMADLKRAMVGDQRLVQNGIRMHYGFVGDNGDLPYSLSDLVGDSGSFVNWNGPYLVGAFDPNDYARDAWGRELQYIRHNPPVEVGGQRIAANLVSLGPDGQAGTDDDLNELTDPELQILESEVWPTNQVEVNQDYVFTAATTVTPVLYTKLFVEHNVPSGAGTTIITNPSWCDPLNVGEVVAGEPKRVSQTLPYDVGLPVGKVVVENRLYSQGDSDCSGASVGSQVTAYVSDGLSILAVNLPTQNYSVN